MKMAFLMSPNQVTINSIPKPQFANESSKSTSKLLPPPFAEPFSSTLTPRLRNPSGLLPWFHSEKPVFRQKSDFIPIQTVNSSQKPWMTGEILYEIRKKHSLLQKAKNEDTIVAWNEFKQQRSVVSQMLRDAKLKHEISSFSLQKDKNFYCDSCDRGFASEKELNNHLAQHIYCSVDGCAFRAHPKIVALHKRMQHDTGLAKKIMSLDTPEDIKKWRNERKRNFPTAKNVERRKKEMEERKSRGELLETKYFGKVKQKFSNQLQNQCMDDFTTEIRGRGRGHRGRGRRRRSRTYRGRGRGNANEQNGRQLPDSQFKQPALFVAENLEENSEDDTNGILRRFKGTETNYETEELIMQTQRTLEANSGEVNETSSLEVPSKCNPERTNRHSRKRKRKFGRNNEVGLETVEVESKDCSSTCVGENIASSDGTNGLLNDATNTLVCLDNHSDIDKPMKISAHEDEPVTKLCKVNENVTPDDHSKKVQCETNVCDSVPKDDEMEEGEIVDSDDELNTVGTSKTQDSDKNNVENTKIPSFFTVNEDEDSEEEVRDRTVKPSLQEVQVPPVKVGGALGSLIATYGEDSESDGEIKADDAPASSPKVDADQSYNKTVRRKPVPDMYPISKRRLTLLEKLLQHEIRKERNTILQCVHHIVKNDFFSDSRRVAP